MENQEELASQRFVARSRHAQAASDVTDQDVSHQREQTTFSQAEHDALVVLRWRSREPESPAHDGALTNQELARLRFVRWLHHSGKVTG